jgi:CelD/BcsL family acetyltransferase involved in cellulose biosynthesis
MNHFTPAFLQTSARADKMSRFDTDDTRAVVLTCMTDLENWGQAWSNLDRQSTARLTYFQSYDWCSTWLKHHGADVTPHVIMVIQGRELVAVWPLMRQSLGFGLSCLCALGDPHTQYSNILTRDGHLNGATISILQQVLAATAGADQLVLNYVPEHSPLHLVLPGKSEVAILRNEAAHFNLQQFNSSADYHAQESKSQRRMRRKATALLQGLGDVRLEVLRPHHSQFSGMVTKCIAMKRMWLQRTGRIGMGLTHADHESFLGNLSGDRAAGDGAVLFVLMAGAKPVAFEFGLLQRGHYYSYLGSFAWGWRHASPGSLQIAMTIDWLIDHGVQTFDLLGNPENYKQTWTDATVALASFEKSFTWRGAIYGAVWTRQARPTLKTLYKAMPASWRSSLNIVRQLDFGPVL